MKLRNKKTGEIKECVVIPIDSNGYPNEYQVFEKSDSLAELNAEWEDCIEPKEYWCITGRGNLHYLQDITDENDKDHKEIGNYFASREEAEKAVERLCAWKRLKDKGFKFNKWTIPEEPKTSHIKLAIEAEMDVPDSPYNLELLFEGEE